MAGLRIEIGQRESLPAVSRLSAVGTNGQLVTRVFRLLEDCVDGAAAQRSARNYKMYEPPNIYPPPYSLVIYRYSNIFYTHLLIPYLGIVTYLQLSVIFFLGGGRGLYAWAYDV